MNSNNNNDEITNGSRLSNMTMRSDHTIPSQARARIPLPDRPMRHLLPQDHPQYQALPQPNPQTPTNSRPLAMNSPKKKRNRPFEAQEATCMVDIPAIGNMHGNHQHESRAPPSSQQQTHGQLPSMPYHSGDANVSNSLRPLGNTEQAASHAHTFANAQAQKDSFAHANSMSLHDGPTHFNGTSKHRAGNNGGYGNRNMGHRNESRRGRLSIDELEDVFATSESAGQQNLSGYGFGGRPITPIPTKKRKAVIQMHFNAERGMKAKHFASSWDVDEDEVTEYPNKRINTGLTRNGGDRWAYGASSLDGMTTYGASTGQQPSLNPRLNNSAGGMRMDDCRASGVGNRDGTMTYEIDAVTGQQIPTGPRSNNNPAGGMRVDDRAIGFMAPASQRYPEVSSARVLNRARLLYPTLFAADAPDTFFPGDKETVKKLAKGEVEMEDVVSSWQNKSVKLWQQANILRRLQAVLPEMYHNFSMRGEEGWKAMLRWVRENGLEMPSPEFAYLEYSREWKTREDQNTL